LKRGGGLFGLLLWLLFCGVDYDDAAACSGGDPDGWIAAVHPPRSLTAMRAACGSGCEPHSHMRGAPEQCFQRMRRVPNAQLLPANL